MLLESLVRKYGKNGVKNAIKNINESLTHRDYAELEQIIGALINNNEKLTKEDKDLLDKTQDKKRIIVVNKMDLESKIDIKVSDDILYISSFDQNDISLLEKKIKEICNYTDVGR